MTQQATKPPSPSAATALGLAALVLTISIGGGFLVTRGFEDQTKQLLGRWDSPFWLSVRVTLAGTLLGGAAGIACAYLLAKGRFPGRDLLEALGSLPIILPPTVLGYYLLDLFKDGSKTAPALDKILGGPVLFHWRGLIIVAAIAAFPFVLRSGRAAIAGVDPKLEEAARAMGLPEWRVALQVTLPAARRGTIVGLTLGGARAWGEYGATLMIGGSIAGKTTTMSIAVTNAQNPGQQMGSLLDLMLIVALAATIGLTLLERRRV